MNLINKIVKPTALSLAQEVELWYALLNSLQTLCAKLDDDGTVNGVDYEDLCFTAIINTVVENGAGSRVGVLVSNQNFFNIRPTGLHANARWNLMYNYVNAWETLCEKLDLDSGVADANYEALCFTATFLHKVRDPKSVLDLGNGTTYYFGPGPVNRSHLVEWFYNAVYSLYLLTAKLDLDSTVTDENYAALCYTATMLMKVENGAGSTIGN
jgi:hypothetical protein